MACSCFIIPKDILEKFSKDINLSKEIRKASKQSLKISSKLRKVRIKNVSLTRKAITTGIAPGVVSTFPTVSIYNCKHKRKLPGLNVSKPDSSSDATAKNAFKVTQDLAKFYKEVFGRNSIDGSGMEMISSVHYGVKYNNAMWNGEQMIYGDGDKELFIDFTNGTDVIGHELTHGVTQHTLQLEYSDDAGGLNESMSDCFGAMFRQWLLKQDSTKADWLIGSQILGPAAKKQSYTSLRNMSKPSDQHALSSQPDHYSQIHPGIDPHYSSGPPNFAFYLACFAVKGKSWETVGKIWYNALTVGASPNMKMPQFAERTRNLSKKMFKSKPAVFKAVDTAWKKVGL